MTIKSSKGNYITNLFINFMKRDIVLTNSFRLPFKLLLTCPKSQLKYIYVLNYDCSITRKLFNGFGDHKVYSRVGFPCPAHVLLGTGYGGAQKGLVSVA